MKFRGTLFLFSLFFLLSAMVNSQEFRSSREDFQKMTSYLASGSGQWMGANPKHDPDNPNSAKALGLWFDKRLDGRLLHLSVIIYRGDTANVISDAMWIWHPGEQRIKLIDINVTGRLQEGETYFNSENVFVTRNYQYQPNGQIVFARGENIILTEDRHKTTSYIFQNDTWQIQGSFEWQLVEEGKGYKAIKYN